MESTNELEPFQSWSQLRAYDIEASDGTVGAIDDLYFDDASCAVRYLVVNTGTWLTGRRVLVPPAVLTAIDDGRQFLHVRLTREQVQHSPPMDAERPVSRQYEEQYYRYFRWEPYWDMVANPPALGMPPEAYALTEHEPAFEEPERHDDPHLRSATEIIGYAIQARDGAIGHVDDLLIDRQRWTVSYLEVDIGHWWPGRRALLATRWIERIDWPDRKVFVDVSREAIRSAPDYVRSEPITRHYEERLYRHYGARGYWD